MPVLARQNYWDIGRVIGREMRNLPKYGLWGKIHHCSATPVHAIGSQL